MLREVHVTCPSNVLIIGDSHTLLSGAAEAFPDCDISARYGRESSEGLEVLETTLRPDHEVVVFDLSTNDVLDPPAFEANLDRLLERADDRQVVLVNAWRADFRNLHRRVNGILQRFAERHPDRVTLVDWAGFIGAHPAPLGDEPDYIHFTSAVYRDRAVLVSDAIAAARERAGSSRPQ